jgi:hypothetical protein
MPCMLGWRQTFYYNRFPRLGLTVTTEVLDLDLSLTKNPVFLDLLHLASAPPALTLNHPRSATFTLTVNDGTPALT